MMPQVSVIIPTYNREQLVTEAIKSVMCQNFQDLEIIIVDDGSTDRTREIIGQFNEPRIRYYYKANSGVSSARNKGMDLARGEFIAFLDSDDIWEANYLDTIITDLHSRTEYGAAYGRTAKRKMDGSIDRSWRKEFCESGWITAGFFMKGFFPLSSLMIRSQILNRTTRFDEALTISEDLDFVLRLSLRTKFLYVPDAMVICRSQQDGLTLSSYDDGFTLLQTLFVLHRFYWDLGGREKIDKKAAMHRLGYKASKIAKSLYSQGARKTALSLYRMALSYGYRSPKVYLRLMAAFIGSGLIKKETRPLVPEFLKEFINS